MADSSKALERKERILQMLKTRGSVSVQELAAELRVSTWTVRRDLTDLEDRHLLDRSYGLASTTQSPEYQSFLQSTRFAENARLNTEGKQRIAQRTAALLQEGQQIVMGAGTTTTEVALALAKRGRRLTIMTNALNIAVELAGNSAINATCTGGNVHGDYYTLTGPVAERALKAQFFDVAVIGVSGVAIAEGVTVNSPLNAQILDIMVQQAGKTIIVADHSKIGSVCFARLMPLQAGHILVTHAYPDRSL